MGKYHSTCGIRSCICVFIVFISTTIAVNSSENTYLALYELAESAALSGKVMTVSGPLEPEELGFTLMHEHLFLDWFPQFQYPDNSHLPPAEFIRLMQQLGWSLPVTQEEWALFNTAELELSIINEVRKKQRLRTNYIITDEEIVSREVQKYKQLGGKTIVDLTPVGLDRNPERLRRFAEKNDIKIIMGTAWYRWPFHPPNIRELNIDDLTAIMVKEIVQGSGPQSVHAGIIGEIPIDSRSIRINHPEDIILPYEEIRKRSRASQERLFSLSVAERHTIDIDDIYDSEEIKVLTAAARASVLTGAALSLHAVDPWSKYLELLQKEGVTMNRVIVGHGYYHFQDLKLLKHTLEQGVMLETDYLLQRYASHSPVGPVEAILDGVVWAIENGYRDQILFSLDICKKVGQQTYGGGGYTTLHDYVFPYLRSKGISESDIEHITVKNPKRLLTLTTPRPLITGEPHLP